MAQPDMMTEIAEVYCTYVFRYENVDSFAVVSSKTQTKKNNFEQTFNDKTMLNSNQLEMDKFKSLFSVSQ